MNIRMDGDTFAYNAQVISKNFHEVLLLKIVLQTNPQVKNMNIKFYDLYYTVNRIRKEKDIEEEQKKL